MVSLCGCLRSYLGLIYSLSFVVFRLCIVILSINEHYIDNDETMMTMIDVMMLMMMSVKWLY